jgi:LPPG:FO 2-phospho-L-lactate transferase
LAVTPIIGGKAIKGPAAKMMTELGLDVSPAAIAQRYADFIDAFIVDESDPVPEPIPGVQFLSAATLMTLVEDRLWLARAVLRAADALR